MLCTEHNSPFYLHHDSISSVYANFLIAYIVINSVIANKWLNRFLVSTLK